MYFAFSELAKRSAIVMNSFTGEIWYFLCPAELVSIGYSIVHGVPSLTFVMSFIADNVAWEIFAVGEDRLHEPSGEIVGAGLVSLVQVYEYTLGRQGRPTLSPHLLQPLLSPTSKHWPPPPDLYLCRAQCSGFTLSRLASPLPPVTFCRGLLLSSARP